MRVKKLKMEKSQSLVAGLTKYWTYLNYMYVRI